MEKFGIFELLDALAAFTEPAQTPEPPPPDEKIAAKKTPDEAFRAPSYGGYEPAARSENTPAESPTLEPKNEGAIGGFLARHNEISRKAKK